MSPHCQSSSPHFLAPPGPRGAVALALTVALLLLAGAWMRHDPRYVGASVLTASVRAVFNQGLIDVPPGDLFQAAAEGLTSTLDPFSAFMPPVEYGWFTEETEGEYVGIGVEIKSGDRGIVIVHVFPQSAAADAMLEPGDRITAIDNRSIVGVALRSAVEWMRGPAGAPVDVEIESREGTRRTVTLVRRNVAVSPFPVNGVSRSGVAYIQWSEFSLGCGDQLAALIEETSVHNPIGVILDLRGNPGGVLDEAVIAAGIFLPEGAGVCRLSDRLGAASQEYLTTAAPSRFEGPLVLVVDETSASAAEIFAASLRESQRTVIVGRRTFGKGWVQSVFSYGESGALRLSTARYYTPGGLAVGDPHEAARLLAEEDSIQGGPTLRGTGLYPDVTSAPDTIGAWERALARAGLFAEFAAALADEWPATGTEDADDLLSELRRWIDSLNIVPDLPGNAILDQWTRPHRQGGPLVGGDTLAMLAERLAEGHAQDAEMLFDRESPRLLLRLWEQRLRRVGHPDPEELEALLDADPVLAAARNLLEEPERYEALRNRPWAGTG